MAILSFKFGQLSMLLLPDLIVSDEFVVDVSFPSEPDFFQNRLSIKSNFVLLMSGPLRANPNP
jgi:hypothetical protein